jgi:hypothetical protein
MSRSRCLARTGLAVAAIVFASASAPDAGARPAKHKKHVKKPRTVFEKDWASAPSAKYAALDKDACLAEARARGVSFDVVDEAKGVAIPIRLTGPLAGVAYHTELPEKERATTPYEVFDCRLVLALYDFGSILTAHGIDEALIFSAWRPPPKSWPEGKLGRRHPGALAVDVRVFEKTAQKGGAKDLVVARDWKPAHDDPPCGDKARVSPDTSEAKELREVYCAAAKARIFTSMLGPNYNKAHANHFHLEITPDVKWRIVL